MPTFGYGVGDFIAGANLTYRLIHALSTTQGTSVEYQDAMQELANIQQTFLQVSQMRISNILSPTTVNAVAHIIISSMEVMGKFLDRTKTYQQRLGRCSESTMVADSWCRMGWALFKQEELKSLRDTLHMKLSAINVLLSSAQLLCQVDVSVPHICQMDPNKNPLPAGNLGLPINYQLPRIESTNGHLGIDVILKSKPTQAMDDPETSSAKPPVPHSHDHLGNAEPDERKSPYRTACLNTHAKQKPKTVSSPIRDLRALAKTESRHTGLTSFPTTDSNDIDARFIRIENILQEQQATQRRMLQLKQDITEEAEVINAGMARSKPKEDELSIWTNDMMMTIRYLHAEHKDGELSKKKEL
ncbi:hypothetical protein MMC14_008848 [Varicellaria rhodocarpa]|nr:hypothetical protein [Varicellaria rhodocarpa]